MSNNRKFFDDIIGIQPRRILEYLWSNGWIETADSPEVYKIFKKGDDKQIFLPLNRDYSDFNETLYRCIEQISQIEDESLDIVVNSIQHTSTDVLRIRFDSPDTVDGTIPLNKGFNLIKKVQDFVYAAAASVSAESKKPYYSGKRTAQIEDYLSKIKLGQTEYGSYVVTVKSPLPLEDQSEILNDASGNFERKVMVELMTSLKEAKGTANLYIESGDMDVFANKYEEGVTANLCGAISDLKSNDNSAKIDFSCKWAPNYIQPEEDEVPKLVQFTSQEISVFEPVSKFLKEVQPLDSFELRGYIIRLDSPNPDDGGRVSVVAYSNDELDRKVIHVDLQSPDYHIALSAHDGSENIYCTGRLEKEGRNWVLKDYSNFRIDSFGQTDS